MGGGSLMTPLLILVFGIKPVTAIGTDLAYGAVTKTVGGWRHWRLRTVDFRLSTWMGIGSIPAAIGGVAVLSALEDAVGGGLDAALLGFVGGALILSGAATLAKGFLVTDPARQELDSAEPTRRNKVMAVAIGALVGFVLGITSAGSGALIAVALILVFRLAPRRVVGTDVFHAAILLWAAAIAHIAAGNVDWLLALNIVLGSVPGVWAGTAPSSRTPVAVLRSVLGVVLVGSGLGLLTKAGVPIPAPVLAAVPLAVGALVLQAHVRGRRRRDRLAQRSPAPFPTA